MKKNEETFTSIPVGKIVLESNRKHGGMGNIEVLAESIKAEGLINPPTAVANEDGAYRIVAGRRRIAAVRQLGWEEVPARVIDEADADRLESIGLAENVNRQEMHPLDEAETFKKLMDRGTAVEDIAAYYDRTAAGIHHRVRLCGLIDGVKEMFRDGKINLSGAALIAGLPAEDQEKFHKKYGEKGANHWDISEFIRKAQRLTLEHIADAECGTCGNRTHNTAPGLFDEYQGLKDVCFDGECYAGKWKKLIAELIAGQPGDTGKKIILDQDIPKFLPKNTETVTIAGEEFTLLAHNKHTWSETSRKSKKDTAWLVSIPYGSYKVTVSRAVYKEYKQPGYGSYSSAPADPVKEYLIGQVPEIREEDRKAVAEKVKAAAASPYRFREEVKQRVLRAVIGKRLREESRENMAAIYLADKFSGPDENIEETEDETILDFTDEDDREIFETVFGPEGIVKISDVPEEPLSEKLFLFLTAASLGTNQVPGLDDSEEEWRDTEKDLFWKFAQMERDEYLRLYRDILAETVKEAAGMEPGEPEDQESAWGEDDGEDFPGEDG